MTVVRDNRELVKYCNLLQNSEYIAVDTEFQRERTYYPKLCLVQIASEDISFAVDPLVKSIDLSPLLDLILDKSIVKVFHAAKQDLEIIYNLTGKIPEPVFDTQVAAMVCGFGASVSYAKLVSKLLDIHIDKTSRFMDWSCRPLLDEQVTYALGDVVHLCGVYKKLKTQVEEAGRLLWMNEEMKYLTSIETYKEDVDSVFRKVKTRSGSPIFLGIVYDLIRWREDVAKELNKPRGHILRDQTLVEIAAYKPSTISELENVRGVNRIDSFLQKGMFDVIKSAKPIKISEDDKNKFSATDKPLVDLLKVLLKAKCEEHNVAEKIVASRDDLAKIAAYDEPEVHAMSGWRYDIFGKYAESLKRGEIALSAKNGNIDIVNLKI